ncbi:MAG: secretin N-terminal domain-containing protein, partial [Novipirellula sp. JB048]
DSGILAGAVITADPGANSLVVRAPASSMPLIHELIRQLDKTPGIDSLVKVFTVENGDAVQLTTALTELFGAEAATRGTSVGAGNLAGLPNTTAARESSLVPLRFSTDQRTNSIIASGSAEDLEVVESILLRLDGAGFSERITEVIWLRHQSSDNIAAAIQQYVQQRTQSVNTIQQFQQGGLGPFDLPDRDLIVVSEPTSNTLLLSVSPRLYEDVRRLIDKLDRRPPMVLIKVLLAEVKLDDFFEIGGEVGLQDSLMFDRGIAAEAIPGNPAVSDPGFNFNNNSTPNENSFGKESLAGRGLTSFGVGAANGNLNYGGFVLSAASESVSLLLRTLQDSSRLQILSRPQIMTMDNTEGLVQVGRTIAQVTDVINNGVAGTQVVTTPLEIGLIMRVRPRVGADGLIIMDIDAERSDRDASRGTPVPTGDGSVLIQDILKTTAQSTVAAYSGQTVIFGGLIQKTRANISRRVPFLADIPLLGYFFKYDQETESRSELLVILTPMLVTGEEDLDYVKATESSRMSWCLADVVEMHGDVGLSGGYGLWGPATGGTIYPDLQPTVDHFHQPTPYSVPHDAHSHPRILSEDPMMIDSGASALQGPVIYDSSSLPEHSLPQHSSSFPEHSQPRAAPQMRPNPEHSHTPSAIPEQQNQPPAQPPVPLTQHDAMPAVQHQTAPLGSPHNDPAPRQPAVTGPVVNPYGESRAEPSTNQVAWWQASSPAPALDRNGARGTRPPRLGNMNPTNNKRPLEPHHRPGLDSANAAQPIPSISPQSWIQ